ncbi:hypothetical protein CEY16_14335 [Halalkalibacillus sediminis]|uniref:DUF2508 domain-containing protein n=1 Tax=Halalkalibacillus sediminis TaxID=2018042 RepID=A0A2I0QQC4_9BACI|nr:hypothetical protein [Halalkalibacillus sediminis]PKR76535.1 hypothetical protein CEY16_14335 [Halalkalibacillus sediminis]
MIGLLLNDIEQKELEYLLKREMDELVYDFNYQDMDQQVKKAIKERYIVLFDIYKRFANQKECLNYIPKKNFSDVK